MARVAPTIYEFVEADNGDYLKVAEAVFRIFDRQDWLRVNRARARIKVLVDKIGADAFRELLDEELRGDWVDEREFGPELVERLRFDDDEEPRAPKAHAEAASPNGDRQAFERFVDSNVQTQSQEGFSTVEVKITRGDLTPEQFRGLGPDHARLHRRQRPLDRAAEPGPALGPRRVGLRRLDASSPSSASATPAPARSPTSSPAPAPTAANSGSPPRWASTGPSKSGSTRWRSTTS